MKRVRDQAGPEAVGEQTGELGPARCLSAVPSNAGGFKVESVLDARQNKRGKLTHAKLAWAPTWERAENLSSLTEKEAYKLLFS